MMPSGGDNKRAHIRYSVNMPVEVSGAGMASARALMADFCLGGMLVEFDGQGVSLDVNDRLTVAMEVQGLRGLRTVTLTGEVVRVSDGSAGLRFIEPDGGALLAAQNHVRELAASQGRTTGGGSKAVSPEQAQKAMAAVMQVLDAFLHERMEMFLPRAEEALLDAADKMTTNQDQHPYFEAGKLLAHESRHLQQNFYSGAVKNLELVMSGGQVDAGETFKGGGGGLSLVDKEVFEDWITLKVMATRAESQFHDALLHLQLRFDQLFGISLSARRNPLHPALLCNAFGTALRLIPLRAKTDRIILEVFEQTVVNSLGDLYAQCNEILSDNGVLKELDVGRYLAERYGRPAPPGTAGSRPPASKPAAEKPVEDRPPAEKVEATPAPQEPVAAPAQAPAAEQAVAVSEPAAKQFSVQQNIARHAYEAVQRLMSLQAEKSRGVGAAASGDVVAAEPVKTEEFNHLLSSLQRQGEAQPEAPLGDRIQQALADEHGERAALDHQLATAVEVIQNLFEGILGNAAISELVRNAIRRLELPFLRLLLTDDSFLRIETHPARQVLNRMAKLGVRGSANLQSNEQEIVQRAEVICGDFDGDVGVFESALGRLDELSSEQDQLYQRNLRRVQESSEGKHKVSSAKREVGKALERRIGGKRVPTAVLSLIDAGWSTLLLRTLLRGGRDSAEWHEYLGVVDTLISAATQLPPQEKLRKLLASIKQGLREVDETQVHNKRLLSDLKELLGARTGEGKEAPMVDVPAGVVDGSENSDLKEMEKRWLKRAQRARIDDVFEQKTDNEESSLLRLAWVDQECTTFVFVNPRGLQVFDLTLNEFAGRLASGEMKAAEQEDLSAVDRGLEQVVRRVYEQMARQGTTDELSGLLNRREMERRLRHRLNESPECTGTLVHLDIDQFNLVNNMGGPQAGDEMIGHIGRLLRDVFPSAIVGRTGGDEFTLWLDSVSPEGGAKAAESFCQRLSSERFDCGGQSFSVTCSAGVVHREGGGELAEELMRCADGACHAAKDQGRNRVHVYASNDADMARRDDVMTWVTRLNDALDQDRLMLRCQRIEPTVSKGEKPAYEVLISIVSERGDEIPPAEFLHAAEQYNRMHALDRWVISNVLRWMHAHPQVVEGLDHLSINLSGHSLNDASLPEFLFEHFQRYPVPRERLCFEVTETTAIANLEDAADFIRELQDMGCRFSLDDFGSGLASYGNLKHLPVDYIKIDGTFIRNMSDDVADQALVRSINEMGHLMGKRTIAEYVEDQKTRDFLASIGVDYVQGYGVEKPRRLESLSE